MPTYEHTTRYIDAIEGLSSEEECRKLHFEFIEACYNPFVLDRSYLDTLKRYGLSNGRHLRANVETMELEAAVATLTLIHRAERGVYDPSDPTPLMRAFMNGYAVRLLRRIAELDGTWDRPNVVTFYHEYDKYGFLSNWYAAPFEFAGNTFPTTEHWMMWQKARLFGDAQTAEAILAATDLDEVRRLGRQVKPYVDAAWREVRLPVMRVGLRRKFVQNERLLNDLLATGTAVLAEAAPKDTTWGIGIGPDDPRGNDPAEWYGQNLLGRLLMEVRSELRMASSCGEEAIAWSESDLMRSQFQNMSLLELARIPSTRPAALMYATFCAQADSRFRDAHDVLREVRSPLHWIIRFQRQVIPGQPLTYAGYREFRDELALRARLDSAAIVADRRGSIGGESPELTPQDRGPSAGHLDAAAHGESFEDACWAWYLRAGENDARRLDDGDLLFLESLVKSGGDVGELAGLVLAANVSAFVNAIGNDDELARKCESSKDLRRVILLGLHLGAALADGMCANILGAMYYLGNVVRQDYGRAKELYELADSAGIVQGTVNLGYICEYGRCGDPDYDMAYRQYAKAAAVAGHFEALYKLGDMYARGHGVAADLRTALALYDRSLNAAEGVVQQAQPAFRIAELISEDRDHGQGIPFDPMGALSLYQLAERGLRVDIAHGHEYYRDRLHQSIAGQERMRKVLDEAEFWAR